jgi:hypothetical protein
LVPFICQSGDSFTNDGIFIGSLDVVICDARTSTNCDNVILVIYRIVTGNGTIKPGSSHYGSIKRTSIKRGGTSVDTDNIF